MLEVLHLLERIHEAVGVLFIILIYIIASAMPATLLLGSIKMRPIIQTLIVQITITLALLVCIAHMISEPGYLDLELVTYYPSRIQLAPFISAFLISIGIGVASIPRFDLIQPFNIVGVRNNMQQSWKVIIAGTTVALLLLIPMMKAPIWSCEYKYEMYCFVWNGSI